MGVLLKSTTRDGYDVLSRAYMESRDLLMTFRFDDKGARQKIAYWFDGKRDNSWKADHNKCVEFLMKLGTDNLALGERWSMLTVLSHPTVYAAEHSAGSLAARMPGRADAEHMSQQMMIKRADFLVSVSRFMMVVNLDLPGWITLVLDHDKMPNVEAFRDSVENVATPFLRLSQDGQIPEKSYIPTPKS